MKIVALSGRKQSGKNTAFNFLLGLELLKLGLVRDKMLINQKGELMISDLFGDKRIRGVFDITRNSPSMIELRETQIYPFLRNYSFADILKKTVCMDILGLTYQQCYGTDAQKMEPTKLRWEDMPGINEAVLKYDEQGNPYADFAPLQRGFMSGRDVMQYVGTDIFRKIYSNVWADATIRTIKRHVEKHENSLAVITDCRFPNEVATVQDAGGKVVRLTRNPHPEDQHSSETALDPENFDWKKFDYVLQNDEMSIQEQNDEFYKYLDSIDYVDHIDMDKLYGSE